MQIPGMNYGHEVQAPEAVDASLSLRVCITVQIACACWASDMLVQGSVRQAQA